MRGARPAVSILFFVNGAVLASWLPHIPAVKARLTAGDGQLGLVLLAMAAGAVAALPAAGWLIARWGSRVIASIAALGFCLAMPLPVLSPSLSVLAAALAVLGACNGVLDVSMNAQAAAVEQPAGRAIMSSFHALFSLGGVAGSLLAAGAMKAGLSEVAHVTAISLASLAAVSAALTSLVSARPAGTAKETALAPPSRELVGLGILALLGLLAEGAVADWSAVYLHDTLAASPALAAGGFAAFSVAMAAGRFTGDAMVRRFGGSRVLRASGAIAAGGLACALLAGHPVAGIVGCGLVGLGIANIVPVLFSAAARVPGVEPGRALSAVATIGYLGFLAGPPLIGGVAEAAGLAVGLGLVSVVCAVVAMGAGTLPEP